MNSDTEKNHISKESNEKESDIENDESVDFNESMADILDETFEASFRDYSEYDVWNVKWIRRQDVDSNSLVRLPCAAILRVPQLCRISALGDAAQVFNSKIDFKYNNFIITSVQVSGEIVCVIEREKYNLYKLEDLGKEVTVIQWNKIGLARDKFESAKAGIKYLPSGFAPLLPLTLDPVYALGSKVTVSARLSVFREQLQLCSNQIHILTSEASLNSATNEADYLYKIFYNSKSDFTTKPPLKSISSVQLLQFMKSFFPTNIVPGVEEVCKILHRQENRLDNLSFEQLQNNVSTCFLDLMNNGRLLKTSSYKEKYNILDDDIKLYDYIKSLIRDYDGEYDGIELNEILKSLHYKIDYKHFCMKTLKAYLQNALSRSDFIEVDNQRYMIV